MPRRLALPTIAAIASLATASALAGCGSSDSPESQPDTVAITASFYPLQWASEQVGGDLVTVTGLTKPGVEPHDLELTPKAVGAMASSALVVYLSGFQPAVDAAVEAEAADTAFDVATVVDLSLEATPDGHDHGVEEEEDESGVDPHFWLDPTRFAVAVAEIGDRLAAIDAPNAQTYQRNAAALVADLSALDQEFQAGLASCTQDELVTSHTAFAYLAQRYGFHQEGIAGVSPDIEPNAATLAAISELVRDEGVTTIYTETLASPALAQTVARETGASVAVLDPVEGITDQSQGTTYLEVMRSNLATLRAGQECP